MNTLRESVKNYKEFMSKGYLIKDFWQWRTRRDSHFVWDLVSQDTKKHSLLIKELLDLRATETR